MDQARQAGSAAVGALKSATSGALQPLERPAGSEGAAEASKAGGTNRVSALSGGDGGGAGATASGDAFKDEEHDWTEPVYATRIAIHPSPHQEMPVHSMPAGFAKRMVEDMMLLDVNPRLNLSTFVNTWIEPEAEELMQKAASYNLADAVQYASAAEMEKRCINFLAHLWHAPDDNFVGTGAVGSSEACYLGGLALKKRWQAARRAAGKPADRPNIVVSHIAQVCWQKFCSYFDVEPHYVDVTEDCLVLDPEKMRDTLTKTQSFEPVERVDAVLEEIWQERGLEVPLHVDAANAGLVAPLCRPDVLFDFRLRHVASINVSGHKYGLVYCGCAFIVWRNREFLPRDMVFTVAYLGKEEENLTINFSRPGAQTSAQYYNFIRLGQEGYRRTFDNFFRIYNALRDKVERMGCFQILSTGDMPVLAFRLKPLEGGNKRPYNEYDIMMGLGEHRWMVPAYTMAPAASDMHLLRVCLRVGFDLEMADMLAHHLEQVISKLEKHTSPAVPSPGQAYVEEQSQRAKEFKRRAGPC